MVWWTRRQKSVSASSAQAEYFAAALASREGSYVRDLVADLGYPLSGPTPLMLDSKSAIDLAFDPVAFKRTKHILRASNELRDKVAKDLFKPVYVEAAGQRADILTKGLGPTQHQTHLVQLLSRPARCVTRGAGRHPLHVCVCVCSWRALWLAIARGGVGEASSNRLEPRRGVWRTHARVP